MHREQTHIHTSLQTDRETETDENIEKSATQIERQSEAKTIISEREREIERESCICATARATATLLRFCTLLLPIE